MILTIDIGNSRVKCALFHNNVMVRHYVFSYGLETIESCLELACLPLDADKVIISNVAGGEVEVALTSFLDNAGCSDYQFAASQSEQCGVINAYAEYTALGVDRWLAMIAGFNHPDRKQGQAVCVVDCGTAMTFDVVDNKGRHLGGLISPGFKLMQSMLNNKTSHIKVNTELGLLEDEWLSHTTSDAVGQGCARLLVGGVSSMLKQCINEQEDVFCVVTGGDGGWVADALEVKVLQEPLLVNQGLLRIACEN